MKRTIYNIFTCLLATSLLTAVCTAQVEEMAIGNTFGVGARTMGMGGASLGLADDFTALYWNPAGIAQIRKFELFTSFSHTMASANTAFNGTAVTDSSRSRLRPNSVGFVYPFYTKQGGLAIALGYNRQQNFDYQTEFQGLDPTAGNEFSGLVVAEMNANSGGIGIWSFGGSVFISKHILIGGAIDFWEGESLNELNIAAKDTRNIDSELASFRYDDDIERKYSGISGRVGILANLTDALRLGLTLVAPTELVVDEFWREYTVAFYDDGEEASDAVSGAQAFSIERPFEVGAGFAVKLLDEQLILAADVQFTDWTQTRYDPAPAEDISLDNFERFYATTLQARLGAEYRIPTIDTHLRFGYFRDTIPFTATSVENERDFLTVGVGKIFEETMRVDFAYMRGNWELSGNSLTTERTTHRIFASAAYQF